jgi:hypothetical protein
MNGEARMLIVATIMVALFVRRLIVVVVKREEGILRICGLGCRQLVYAAASIFQRLLRIKF